MRVGLRETESKGMSSGRDDGHGTPITMIVVFHWSSLCTRHYFKSFTCIFSLVFPKTMRKIPVRICFTDEETETLSG